MLPHLVGVISEMSRPTYGPRRRRYYEEEDDPGCTSDARGQRLLASHSGSANSEVFPFSPQHTLVLDAHTPSLVG